MQLWRGVPNFLVPRMKSSLWKIASVVHTSATKIGHKMKNIWKLKWRSIPGPATLVVQRFVPSGHFWRGAPFCDGMRIFERDRHASALRTASSLMASLQQKSTTQMPTMVKRITMMTEETMKGVQYLK